jgi:hypothetical protein
MAKWWPSDTPLLSASLSGLARRHSTAKLSAPRRSKLISSSAYWVMSTPVVTDHALESAGGGLIHLSVCRQGGDLFERRSKSA